MQRNKKSQSLSLQRKQKKVIYSWYNMGQEFKMIPCGWCMDSGCSNHMSGERNLFRNLDESFKIGVRLGDNKEISVEGKGTVALNTLQGGVKLLHNVQFVPGLAHNL